MIPLAAYFFLVAVAQAVMCLLAVVCAWMFPITKESHAETVEAIREKKTLSVRAQQQQRQRGGMLPNGCRADTTPNGCRHQPKRLPTQTAADTNPNG